MSRFEIYLSKNDLEHIANGHDIKIKINGKIFLTTNEIILKPALMNDVMAPILNYKNKIIDTEQQNIVNSFIGGGRMIPKFRAWDNWRERMSVVDRIYIDTKGVRLYDDFGEYWRDFNDVKLMQSTGLKDKNGKEIFEGDILKVANNDSSWFEVVKYDHDKAMFISKEVNLKYEVPETPLYDLFSPYLFKVEVIGYIWEDCDLIDGKKVNEN